MVSQVSVVIGASRGIGLELAKVLHRSGHVFATCRKKSSALSDLDAQNTTFHAVSGVDVESTEGCTPLANIAASSVDLVICNAGVLTNDDFSSLDFSDCTWQFNTNALGPLRAVQALLPKLQQGSQVVLIGSHLGSFMESRPGKRYGYRMSKCAAHMAFRCLTEDLKPHGITVVIIHPGTVQTDMVDLAGVKADVSVADSVAGIARVIEGLSMSDTGTFLNYLGQPMAW